MLRLLISLLLACQFVPIASADEIEISADYLNNIHDLKKSLNDLAQGNEGKGWVESATVSFDNISLVLKMKAKIRHKHKTNGVTIYSNSETLSGRVVARNCEIVEVDASSSGYLSDILLRNRKFLRDALYSIVKIPELTFQMPDNIRNMCEPERFSLESFNFPNYYIRHQNSEGRIDPVVSDLDRADATFKKIPGLADSSCMSFEASNYPGHYLRHSGFRIYLQPNDYSNLFAADATFCSQPGRAGVGDSYESWNYRGYFLRHSGYLLFISSESSDIAKADSTFYANPPLLP